MLVERILIQQVSLGLLLRFHSLSFWGFPRTGHGLQSFPVSWVLLVSVGCPGGETCGNRNAKVLMQSGMKIIKYRKNRKKERMPHRHFHSESYTHLSCVQAHLHNTATVNADKYSFLIYLVGLKTKGFRIGLSDLCTKHMLTRTGRSENFTYNAGYGRG